jgi:hypothetical protein
MSIVGAVRFEGWVPIASRPRSSRNLHCKLFWSDIIDAPISAGQARALAQQGRLLIACKHYDDRIELMVRTPPYTPVDPGKPASSVDAAFRLAGARVRVNGDGAADEDGQHHAPDRSRQGQRQAGDDGNPVGTGQ